MTGTFVVSLDVDTAMQLGDAIYTYRQRLQAAGIAEASGLAALQRAAYETVRSTQKPSRGVMPARLADDGLSDREWLTRKDVQRLAHASEATVDRWIRGGRLRSQLSGRLRRIRRADLEVFLAGGDAANAR